MHVPVVIIGAGPSGSLLAWILAQRGIESLVLERRSRGYVEGRIRAGVMEQNSADLMIKAGIGDRLQKECLSHDGVVIGLENKHYFINFQKLIGRGVKVYGQAEVTKDLLAGLDSEGHDVLYEAAVSSITDIDTNRPTVTYHHLGKEHHVSADFVAGCDGFHGPSRTSIPVDTLTSHEKSVPVRLARRYGQCPPF